MEQVVFQDSHFRIDYVAETNLLKGTFIKCNSSDHYTGAIRNFKTVYERVKPHHTLWDNTSFQYMINPKEQLWTDSFLNEPATKEGIVQKVGIILGPDTFGVETILDMFDAGKADVNFKFFLAAGAAESWFKNENAVHEKSASPDLLNIEDGIAGIQLKWPVAELPYLLKHLRDLEKSGPAFKELYTKYLTLTPQEKKITALILEGWINKEIAGILNISEETVKTHRKRILKKLDCNSTVALSAYKVIL